MSDHIDTHRILRNPYMLIAVTALVSCSLFAEEPSEKMNSRVSENLLLLASDSSELRLAAINELGGIGPGAAEAIPVLISMLDSDTETDRINAAWALGKIAPRRKDVLEAEIQALNSGDINLAYNAALALEWAGEEALPYFLQVSKESSDLLALYYSAFYLNQHDESGAYRKMAIGIYGDLIASENEHFIQAGLNGIKNLGTLDPTSLGLIQSMLQHSTPAIREDAAEAAQPYGLLAKSLSGTLIEIAQNDDARGPRIAAIVALSSVTRDEKAINALIGLLGENDKRIRAWAQTSIAKFGRAALPHLKSSMRSKNKVVRLGALDSIAQLNIEDNELVDLLLSEYETADWESQIRMLYALWSVGKMREDVQSFLEDKLENDPSEIIQAHALAIVNHFDSEGI